MTFAEGRSRLSHPSGRHIAVCLPEGMNLGLEMESMK